MKWFSYLALAAFILATTACEKHEASALPQKHGTGEHHAAEAKGGAAEAPVPSHGTAVQPKEAKPHAEPTPGDANHAPSKPAEAPKFFPETK